MNQERENDLRAQAEAQDEECGNGRELTVDEKRAENEEILNELLDDIVAFIANNRGHIGGIAFVAVAKDKDALLDSHGDMSDGISLILPTDRSQYSVMKTYLQELIVQGDHRYTDLKTNGWPNPAQALHDLMQRRAGSPQGPGDLLARLLAAAKG